MLQILLHLSLGLLALVSPTAAQIPLPYNPTRLVPAQNGSAVFIFSPQPSSTEFSLSRLNTSETVDSSSSITTLFPTLPFLSSSDPRAFLTLPDDDGISVLVGDCTESAQDLELWRFTYNADFRTGVWRTLVLTTTDESLSVKYLSAGFTFSPTNSLADASFYAFGGMCPNGTNLDATNWVSDATYSNTMLTIVPNSDDDGGTPYQLSLTGARAPPIAEAGLTITPLTPTFSNTSDTNVSQQQNFVLLGGHTQSAFINMSQLAIFSLPQQSWAFVTATQPSDPVEPRSGHTAILTEDGSKIVVFGGWVGDVTTPAEPQLVVLEVDQEYGGQGEWTWTTPTSKSSPLSAGQGIYGHGVTMLAGGIMMVAGGYSIGSSGSRSKRAVSDNAFFLNTTSYEWSEIYTNTFSPVSSGASSSADSSNLTKSEKAGIGAGLGLGLLAVALVVAFWILYSRRLRARRAVREKELRELALGAERYHTPLPPGEDDQRYPGMRTASWGGIQESKIESSGDPYPWAPLGTANQNHRDRFQSEDMKKNSARNAERTGMQMEIPSPTRGLRKSMNARGPLSYHPPNQHLPTGPGAVFRIEEEDESSHAGSLRRAKSPNKLEENGLLSGDPFEDPPSTAGSTRQDEAAEKRKKEVEGWVEDWQSAAESMTMSRSTSKAHSRTYSNLSQSRNHPAGGDWSGRGSPEKSDRTGSNLSEKSMASNVSFQRSVTGTLSRNVSQRSVSAGYTLFSGAAAAVSRFGYGRAGNASRDVGAGLARVPSNRSVSLNIDSTRNMDARNGTESFSSARNRWGPTAAGEDQALLNRNNQPQQNDDRDYRTLPGSPSKDKYIRGSNPSGRRGMNLLGSMRRVFSGTQSVDVQDRVAAFENHSTQSSPTKHSGMPEMAETTPKRTLSSGTTSFWRSKQGARDWESDPNNLDSRGPSLTIRRKPVPGMALNDERAIVEDDSDWDVETAAQQRVVQVMFTVPKEKLRVVNADALSLLSSNRSEVDQDEERDRDQVKRMSSVREGDEESNDNQADDDTIPGKGKGRAI